MKPSVYRGHEIFEYEGSWAYRKVGTDFIIRKCNSAWSCMVSIDEELSP